MSLLRVAVVADTHLPVRPSRRALPDAVWRAVDDADVVVHAGDWMAPALLDSFAGRSRLLVACWGNNDGDELRARLPEVGRAELDGLRLAVVHETGGAKGREAGRSGRRPGVRCDAAYADDTDVLVFGHSHIPWDTTTPRGLRLLNPGSPTERRRQPVCTFMTAEVRDGRLAAVERHEVPGPTAAR